MLRASKYRYECAYGCCRELGRRNKRADNRASSYRAREKNLVRRMIEEEL